MTKAYLSLGSNLGDRERYLQEALCALAGPQIRVMRVSKTYETAPIGGPEQGWYLNIAAEIETGLSPRALLDRVLLVEMRLGRERRVVNGPRTIDIDILFHGDSVVDEPGLHIPHPRLHERRFVLEPLAELAPDFRHPGLDRTIAELLTETLDQDVRRRQAD